MDVPRNILVLTSALSECGHARAGSLVWTKASHQSSTESHVR